MALLNLMPHTQKTPPPPPAPLPALPLLVLLVLVVRLVMPEARLTTAAEGRAEIGTDFAMIPFKVNRQNSFL